MALYRSLLLVLTILALHLTIVQSLGSTGSLSALRSRQSEPNTAVELEDLFDSLKTATGAYAALLSRPKTQPHASSQNKTSSIIDVAQSLVKQAQTVVGSYNSYVRANPPLNDDRDLIQALSGPTAKYRELIANKAMRHAAALVAEADVALMPPSDPYNVPAPFTNPPGHSDNTLGKRATTPFWMETVGPSYHGTDPIANDPYYAVFRNVKDYGAKGDGKTDDTDAINAAIAAGNRCGANCGTTSHKAAAVYFPNGRLHYQNTALSVILD